MSCLRLLVCILLPALLVNLRPEMPLSADGRTSETTQTALSNKKSCQYGQVTSNERTRPLSAPTFRPLETPLERFAETGLMPRFAALQSISPPLGDRSPRATPLTGMVVLNL